MERFANWLYRVHRAHFMAILVALGVVVLEGGVLVPAVICGALYLHLDLGETVVAMCVTGVVNTLGIVIGAAVGATKLKPVSVWLQGDRRDPAAAWDAASRAPYELSAPGAVGLVPAHLLVTVPLIARLGNLS